jgi:diguanylate cyclase (GGDEF)-like protein
MKMSCQSLCQRAWIELSVLLEVKRKINPMTSLGLLMKTDNAHHRWSIYGLLAVIVAMGMGLSAIIAQTGQEIRSAATPLLKKKLPLLEQLSRLESALLQNQLTLNQYFAYSIPRDQFLEVQQSSKAEIEAHFAQLDAAFGTSPELSVMRSINNNLINLGPHLDALMTAKTIDWDEARAVLVALSILTVEIRQELDKLKTATETEVYAAGDRTSSGIDRIIQLVYLYSLATLITAVFVIHHIRARLRSEHELAHQATHDLLTGLENRRSFESLLTSLPEHPHAIILASIDRFERVIGGLGHEAGDQLMQKIAARLSEAMAGTGSRVFRLDGASFALLYRVMPDRPPVRSVLMGMQTAMAEPFGVANNEVFSHLSIGAANHPADGNDAGSLMRNADAALQAARQNGGNEFVIYSRELNAQAEERLALEAQLGHALEREELVLYYQPQQSLSRGALIGFEALVRWQRGSEMISPAEFIPLAEDSGLIISIGNWILAEACRQARRWNEETGLELVVAINISSLQFRHPDFLQTVKQTLAETGVDPSSIELEITESVAMQNADYTIKLLQSLRQLGLELVIDDFGTGYSSLAYLKRFPLKKLKIDQSFIRHLSPHSNDAAIVQATISLGHSLGFTVIAEGVETSEQLECLSHWGCDEIQGFYYGRPSPAHMAAAFISRLPTL